MIRKKAPGKVRDKKTPAKQSGTVVWDDSIVLKIVKARSVKSAKPKWLHMYNKKPQPQA